jgi:periplasmic copper chaperone A
MVLRRMSAGFVMLAAIAVAGLLAAGDASAHVTVAAPGVTAGASDATINFRVPTESSTASTVGLKVQLPLNTPIAGVLVQQQPGWSATITQTKLTEPIETDDGEITQVVSEISWKADKGFEITPGHFGQFTIIAGKLPDGANSLTFKAIQLYSDGTTVSWIDEAAPGSTADLEHPAPVLQLADATGSAAASAAPSATVDGTQSGASKPAATTGIVLGIIGVLLGGAALALVLLRGAGRRSS